MVRHRIRLYKRSCFSFPPRSAYFLGGLFFPPLAAFLFLPGGCVDLSARPSPEVLFFLVDLFPAKRCVGFRVFFCESADACSPLSTFFRFSVFFILPGLFRSFFPPFPFFFPLGVCSLYPSPVAFLSPDELTRSVFFSSLFVCVFPPSSSLCFSLGRFSLPPLPYFPSEFMGTCPLSTISCVISREFSGVTVCPSLSLC